MANNVERMNYDEYFDPDWDDLSPDEAVVRAFVLGIDTAQDRDSDEDLTSLESVAETGYQRHLIRTAFDEGRRFVTAHEAGVAAEEIDIPRAFRDLDVDPTAFIEPAPTQASSHRGLELRPVTRRMASSTTRMLRLPSLLGRR